MQIRELMTTDVITCKPSDTLAHAAQLMRKENIGSCPVVSGDELVGIITDRDITVRAVARGIDPNSSTVQEFMTPAPVTGDPYMSVEDAMRIMSNNQIRRLPIVDNGKLVGIVALADLAIDYEEEELLAETLEKISEPGHYQNY